MCHRQDIFERCLVGYFKTPEYEQARAALIDTIASQALEHYKQTHPTSK